MLPLHESTAHAAVHRMADAGRRFVCSLHTTCSECTAKGINSHVAAGKSFPRYSREGWLWGLAFLCILLPSEDHSRTEHGGKAVMKMTIISVCASEPVCVCPSF